MSNGTDERTTENPFEGWVTVKQASDIVNRNHATIRYWIDTGKIISYPIGEKGLRVVNIEEVKRYSEKANRLNLPKRGSKKSS